LVVTKITVILYNAYLIVTKIYVGAYLVVTKITVILYNAYLIVTKITYILYKIQLKENSENLVLNV
jgi:hypothetical protein